MLSSVILFDVSSRKEADQKFFLRFHDVKQFGNNSRDEDQIGHAEFEKRSFGFAIKIIF